MTTTTAPAKTSSTKWLAVATTENAIAIGMSTANARSATLRLTRNSSMPSSRFQPAWKLGIAAYSLMNDGGSTVRYAARVQRHRVEQADRREPRRRDREERRRSRARAPPEIRITVRSRRYSSGPRWKSRTPPAISTGQWPQM